MSYPAARLTVSKPKPPRTDYSEHFRLSTLPRLLPSIPGVSGSALQEGFRGQGQGEGAQACFTTLWGVQPRHVGYSDFIPLHNLRIQELVHTGAARLDPPEAFARAGYRSGKMTHEDLGFGRCRQEPLRQCWREAVRGLQGARPSPSFRPVLSP